jgi:hypothetical protein
MTTEASSPNARLKIRTDVRPRNAANRFGMDYAAAAAELSHRHRPIIDVHTHIHGGKAAAIFKRACDLYNVGLVYSQTLYAHVEEVQAVMGDRIRFIAVPDWRSDDRKHSHGEGFLQRIEQFHALGSRIVKFWAAPRGIDFGKEAGDPDLLRLNAPLRIRAMELADELGMMFMVHVGDPDTWFATKYADSTVYGTKAAQYKPLEELLQRFRGPWIAAHFGGSPEDLDFVAGLLERHPNLYLDTSAAKWMIRELSKYPRESLNQFLRRFRGRVLFGSDIVATDEHLESGAKDHELMQRASGPDEAFDLYASRYWALRALWETDYLGESPIADPDLAMVEPSRFNDMSAPVLNGQSMPDDVLDSLYVDAAAALLGEH